MKELDEMVTWMRRRGVAALKQGETAITLATLDEPQERPPAQEHDPKAAQQRIRDEHAANWFPGFKGGSR